MARMRTNAEAFNVLTPEQQDELKDLLEQFGDCFGPHMYGCSGRAWAERHATPSKTAAERRPFLFRA